MRDYWEERKGLRDMIGRGEGLKKIQEGKKRIKERRYFSEDGEGRRGNEILLEGKKGVIGEYWKGRI